MMDERPGRGDVFINCPFDRRYRPMLRAMVFTVCDCGFMPRCALELEDSGRVRIDRIHELIRRCRFGIHDISRTSLDSKTRLPHFNMPFELGLFLGVKRGGRTGGSCLIVDRDRYRYQKYLSDIAGQDIKAHSDDPVRLIGAVRDWLRSTGGDPLPGGADIAYRYQRFERRLPGLCAPLRIKVGELTFLDHRSMVEVWLKATAPSAAAE